MIARPRKKGKQKLAPDQKLENEGVKKKKKKKLHSTIEDVERSSEKPQTRVGSPQKRRCAATKKTQIEGRARTSTQRHQARRGRGERDTLFYTVFPSFQSNGYDQMKSRSDGRYHTPGSRAFDCRQGRWTLTHFSHGSFCQQSSIQAVANPVCQRFRSKLQQDSFDSD
jgi:hypothetical protein